jgi:hypothetical protein
MVSSVTTSWIEGVALGNDNIQAVYMHNRLTVKDVVKVFKRWEVHN